MRMSILEQEDIAKGAPDDFLLQEAQAPGTTALSGIIPQFLVISEILRRKNMRDRFEAEEEQPQGTVSEQIVAEAISSQGIGALQPQMPPGASGGAAQMNAQPRMLAAAGGRMPYPAMAGGGMVPPNSLVEDASKFDTQSLYDMAPAQMAMAKPRDMGIPKVLDDNKPETSLASSLREALSRVRQGDSARVRKGVRFGDLGFRGGKITGRGSMTLPIRGNPLELGASGYVGRGGSGITALDASYKMPKDRFIQGRYHPEAKSWGIQFGGRFNQGGIVRMQEGEQVPPPGGLPFSPMAAYTAQQEQRYEELRKYIEGISASEREAQKDEMMSQALINIGAGIASGNVAAGLEKAGAQVANTRAAQRKREQDLQLELIKERPGSTGAYTDLPSSAKEMEYLFSLNPDLRNLSPEQLQALFFNVKRQNWELAEINGVQTVVRRVGNAFYNQAGAPVTPDAGTVTTVVPGGAVAPVTDTVTPVTDGVDVPAAGEPERVLHGGVDSEGNEIRRSYLNSPIFMQPLETIESLANVADYEEDRQLLRDLRREREEGAGALKARLEGQIATSNRVENTIKRVLNNLSGWSAGSGSLLKGLPGTEARTMQADLNLIRANLAFDRLQQMRNSSPTGGALGQVSELELKLLESAMASVDQGLDPEEFRTRLNDVLITYSQLRDKALQDYAFSMATTTNPDVRAEYDTQMQLYQGIIDGTTPGSEADKETAQKILNEYNSIIEARGTQGLQGGGMVSVDSSGEDLEYLNRLRSDIASLRDARS